ncbi:MAG: hypothetical protein RLZZ367_739, partial [Bacteroidota bacterium]
GKVDAINFAIIGNRNFIAVNG